MPEYEYELELDLGSIRLRMRAKTPEDLIEKFEAIDLEVFQKLSTAIEPRTIPTVTVIESLSLPEFINQCTLTTQMDKALTCCYYLSVIQKEKLINKNDIEITIQQAMLPRINNPNQTLNDLVVKAYLARSNEKKAGLVSYYLTQKGKEYVEKKLLKTFD